MLLKFTLQKSHYTAVLFSTVLVKRNTLKPLIFRALWFIMIVGAFYVRRLYSEPIAQGVTRSLYGIEYGRLHYAVIPNLR